MQEGYAMRRNPTEFPGLSIDLKKLAPSEMNYIDAVEAYSLCGVTALTKI